MASEELRLPIGIPVDTNAGEAADSIDGLRESLASSKNAIKDTLAAMRDLRGGSDEVKAAKDQLRVKLEAEKAAVTATTLKLLEQGAAHAKVAEKTKESIKSADKSVAASKKEADAAKSAKDATKAKADAMSSAIGAAGGPVASLKGKLESLNDVLGGSGGGMAAVAGVAAAAAAAVLAVGAAALSTAVSIGKFIIASADAERSMQLLRKANLAGRDDWARNLGDQVDALARKIPVSKDKLNELGIALAKSRIGGQTMVDTLAAVGGATAAAGDDLGNKLKGIVERGSFTRRFQLSPQELLGMDLDFGDVAKAYAEGMHVSVDAARAALVEGRVRLADGAAALKKAVESKFGAINADKMLSLDNQANKFRADLAALAKDVDITPLLKGIKSLADNFDQTSANGKALKGIVTTIGRAIGVTFAEGVPVLQGFIDKAVYGALKIENYWLRAQIAFRETFGGKTSLEFVSFKAALSGVLGVAETLIPGLSAIVEGAKLLSGVWDGVSVQVDAVKAAFLGLQGDLIGIDWKAIGLYVIDGITGGLASGASKVLEKIKTLGKDIKNAFRGELEIHSPSRAFQRDAYQIPAGAAKGVEQGAPLLERAVDKMTPTPSLGDASTSSSSSSRAGGAVSVTFAPTIVVQGGSGADIKSQLADPSLLQGLSEHLLAMLRAAGFQVPA